MISHSQGKLNRLKMGLKKPAPVWGPVWCGSVGYGVGTGTYAMVNTIVPR